MEDDFTYKKWFLSLDTIGFGAAQPPMVWGWPAHPQRAKATPNFIYLFWYYQFAKCCHRFQ
jgi:hypothetical protein